MTRCSTCWSACSVRSPGWHGLSRRHSCGSPGRTQREHELLVFDRRVGTERVVQLSDDVRDEIAAALHRSPTRVHDQITAARLLERLAVGHVAGAEGRSDHAGPDAGDRRAGAPPPRCRALRARRPRRGHARPRGSNGPGSRGCAASCRIACSRRRPPRPSPRPGRSHDTPSPRSTPTASGAVASRPAARGTCGSPRTRTASPPWSLRLDALTAQAIHAAIDAAAADPAVAGDCRGHGRRATRRGPRRARARTGAGHRAGRRRRADGRRGARRRQMRLHGPLTGGTARWPTARRPARRHSGGSRPSG